MVNTQCSHFFAYQIPFIGFASWSRESECKPNANWNSPPEEFGKELCPEIRQQEFGWCTGTLTRLANGMQQSEASKRQRWRTLVSRSSSRVNGNTFHTQIAVTVGSTSIFYRSPSRYLPRARSLTPTARLAKLDRFLYTRFARCVRLH